MLQRVFGPTIRVLVGVCAAFLLLGLLGCGGQNTGGLPVSGKVTVNGQPLAKGSLTFHPMKDNPTKATPTGTIENGQYTIYTNGKPGAPPGKYKVTIVSQEEVDSTKATLGTKSNVHPSFSDPEQTKLNVEVSTSPKENAYNFSIS